MKLAPLQPRPDPSDPAASLVIHCSKCNKAKPYQEAAKDGWFYNPSEVLVYVCNTCGTQEANPGPDPFHPSHPVDTR